MSSLKAFAFRIIIELVRAPAVDVTDPAEVARLEVVAEDIARAAWVRDGYPFTGLRREKALVLALVVIGKYESDFSEAVARCQITGDRLPWHAPHEGRSIGPWQLMRGSAWQGHSRKEICGNQALAAYLASGVLGRYAASGSVGGLFRGYASGNSGRDTKAARRRCAAWERIARREGFVMPSKQGDRVACWKAPLVN